MNLTRLSVETGLIIIGAYLLLHVRQVKKKLRMFVLRQAQK